MLWGNKNYQVASINRVLILDEVFKTPHNCLFNEV